MQDRSRLLELLDHRSFRSGTALGRELGISRAAVHKQIVRLKRAGLPIEANPGKGYRLADGVVPLRARAIESHLDEQVRSQTGAVFVEQRLDSTNDHLRRLSRDASIHGAVCVAEAQSSGRGRRGNRWVASPYRNLLLSMGWVYESWPSGITGLAVAVGIATVDALGDIGVSGVGMKWPNDVVYGDRKLGGILIDVDGESAGPCQLVVGIGINVEICPQHAALIQQPWIDLKTLTGRDVDRNLLAGACVNRLFQVLSSYDEEGFAPYRQRWAGVDVLYGSDVTVTTNGGARRIQGKVVGLESDGALRLRTGRGTEVTCFQGEVSVRRR